MKKYLALILALVLALGVLAPACLAVPEPSPAPSPEPTPKPVEVSEILRTMEPAKAKAAILMDAETGEVLYELDSHAHNYPASSPRS